MRSRTQIPFSHSISSSTKVQEFCFMPGFSFVESLHIQLNESDKIIIALVCNVHFSSGE